MEGEDHGQEIIKKNTWQEIIIKKKWLRANQLGQVKDEGKGHTREMATIRQRLLANTWREGKGTNSQAKSRTIIKLLIITSGIL